MTRDIIFSSAGLFIGISFLFILSYILITFKSVKEAKRYFKTSEGQQALAGILKFTFVVFIIAGISLMYSRNTEANSLGTWFAYGEVFAGIDKTLDNSPQCKRGGVDDRSTSHGGVRLNIFETHDTFFATNIKYTHHSCAFNVDTETYDGIGLEFTYRFFQR